MVLSRKIFINSKIINRVIWLLTLSDIFTWGLYLIINSLIGIYLSNKLGGNTIYYIGVGTGLYYLAKGGFQIPIGVITDKLKGDKDEVIALLLGNILMGLPYFFFPSITSPVMYYILEFIMGIGAAMNLVNWRKLFAKNLDSGKEGFDYAIYDTIMSLTMILMSLIAGYIASINQSYFDLVMYAIGSLMLSSGIWVISIYFYKVKK